MDDQDRVFARMAEKHSALENGESIEERFNRLAADKMAETPFDPDVVNLIDELKVAKQELENSQGTPDAAPAPVNDSEPIVPTPPNTPTSVVIYNVSELHIHMANLNTPPTKNGRCCCQVKHG